MKKSEDFKLPKWYKLRNRASIKKQIIQELVSEYSMPVKLSPKVSFRPTDLDIKDYAEELYKLGLKQLLMIGKFNEAKTRLSVTDKISKLKRRKALLVRVYHKNGSCTHYVCSKHTRILKINALTYLCPPNKGNFDNKYGMMSYCYHENNPFPIDFNVDTKSVTPTGEPIPDTELLNKTMEFEFAQRLAHSKLKDKINLAVVFSVLGFVCSAATVLLCLKGFDII